MKTNLAFIRRYLDNTFPEVGVDCPNFPVMVVLFSGELLRNTNSMALQQFTGYRQEFIDAIASNLANNGLWKGGQYSESSWLKDGIINREEFGLLVDVAMGCLWYSEEAVNRETLDLIGIEPELKLE